MAQGQIPVAIPASERATEGDKVGAPSNEDSRGLSTMGGFLFMKRKERIGYQ